MNLSLRATSSDPAETVKLRMIISGGRFIPGPSGPGSRDASGSLFAWPYSISLSLSMQCSMMDLHQESQILSSLLEFLVLIKLM